MSESKSWFADLESRTTRAAAAARATLAAQPVCNTPDCVATRAKVNSMGYLGALLGPTAYNVYYNTFGIMFYISATIFVIFLMLTAVHYTMFPIFSFSPNDAGFIPIPTVSDRQITFTAGPAASDISGSFIKIPACSYTLGADVILSGNFMVSQIPRVILYRAKAPVQGGASLESSYKETNIIVWLDPIKNDLFVSAVTTAGIETTGAIENVPVKKVFRLTVVFTNQFLEVYINGKLEQSLSMKNPLVTVVPESYIFPTINSIQQNVMIGNLTMWPRVLTAREIQANESKPIKTNTFFTLK